MFSKKLRGQYAVSEQSLNRSQNMKVAKTFCQVAATKILYFHETKMIQNWKLCCSTPLRLRNVFLESERFTEKTKQKLYPFNKY